jgi:WD40 repeat protein
LQTTRSAAVFSADGKRLAVPHQRRGVSVYETATGREVRSLELDRGQHCRAAAFSPDGTLLVVERSDGTASVFDLESGKATLTVGQNREHPGSIIRGQRVAWSPDGALIARAEGARVSVYDARTGKARGVLAGHLGGVLVSPLIILAMNSSACHTGDWPLTVWEVASCVGADQRN